MASPEILTRAQTRLLKLVVFGLTLTGFAQMPIFKRYYVADLPGLGWLADFHATSVMHYGLAALLLLAAGYLVPVLVAAWGNVRLTGAGRVKLALAAILILSGAAHAAGNLPGVTLGPGPALAVDLAHLGSVMLLGLVALACRLLGRQAWLAAR